MEKIKPILAGLKKHHFWVLISVCVLALLYCWGSAVSEIKDQFQANKTKVAGEFQKVAELNQRPEFPNEKWEEETKNTGADVAKRIKAVSQKIIDSQSSALDWGELYDDEFKAAVRKGDYSEDVRAYFAEAVPEEIKQLRTVIGASDDPDEPGVDWYQENYDFLVKAFSFQAPPSEKNFTKWRDILWSYRVLARIVAQTNEGATDPFNPPIHTVEELGVTGKADYDPAFWNVAGAPALNDNIKVPKVAGYDVLPVRLRVRMEIKHLDRLLTACANADLPFEIQGLRFENPSRLIEVKPPEPVRRGPPRFGGGFGRARLDEAKKKEEEETEEPKPTIGRGTLVEVWGFIYIAKDTDFDALLVGQDGKDEVAATAAPGTLASTQAKPAGQP